MKRKLFSTAAIVLILAACGGADESFETELADDEVVLRAEISSEEKTAEGDAMPVTFTGDIDIAIEDGRYQIRQGERVGAHGTFQLDGERLEFAAPPAPKGDFNCFVDGERTLTEGTAVYEYEYDGNSITLEAVDEPCPTREVILERTWSVRS